MRWLRHMFVCGEDRFWVWDRKGWRCSRCGHLVRADRRDPAWYRLARYQTTDSRFVPL